MQYLQTLIDDPYNNGSIRYNYKISSTFDEQIISYGQLNLRLLQMLIYSTQKYERSVSLPIWKKLQNLKKYKYSFYKKHE